MDENLQALYAMASGYQPLTNVRPISNMTGFEGLPIPGGLPGQLGFMLLGQPLLQRAMSQNGMVPLGMNGMNPYDVMLSMRQRQMQQDAVRAAAEFDRESVVRTLRGVASLTGTPWSYRTQQAASSIGAGIAAASPFLGDVAGDLLDSLAGPQGAASVLAGRVYAAGRYRIDPMTGLTGQSPELTARMAGAVVDDFRNGGYSGFSAGQVGFLFQELQSRGRLRSAYGDRGQDFIDRERYSVLKGMSPDELLGLQTRTGVSVASGGPLGKDDLARLGQDSEFATKVQSMDTDRVVKTLKSYTEAIGAVREIFGEMGRPNAPMRELLNGLEALTAGAATHTDPGTLARTVRQTYNLAKMTGVPLANALMMQQNSGILAGQLGLDPAFATEGVQAGLGGAGAYNAIGMGAYTAWGRINSQQMAQTQAALSLRSSASAVSNQLGAVMRIEDVQGGFAKGTTAAALAESIRRMDGSGTFVDPTTGEVISFSDRARITSILQQARNQAGTPVGLNESDIASLYQQTAQNQSYVKRFQIGMFGGTGAANAELRNFAGTAMDGTFRGRFGAAGAGVGPALFNELLNMPDAVKTDPRQRTAAMAAFLAKNYGNLLANVPEEQRLAQFTSLAEQAYGRLDAGMAAGPYSSIANTAQATLQLLDPGRIAQMRQLQTGASLRSEIQIAMGPLTNNSVLSRIFGALQNQESLPRILGAAAGGVDIGLLNRRLGGPLDEVKRLEAELQDIVGKLESVQDPEERKRLMADFAPRIAALRKVSGEAVDVGRRFGLDSPQFIGRDITRAQDAGQRVRRLLDNTSAFRTGAGEAAAPPTREQIDTLRTKYGLSEADAEEMAMLYNQVSAAGLQGEVGEALDDATWEAVNTGIGRETAPGQRFAGLGVIAATFNRFRRAGGRKAGTVRDGRGSITMSQADLDRYEQAADQVRAGMLRRPEFALSYTTAARAALARQAGKGEIADEATLIVPKAERDEWLKKNKATITPAMRDAIRGEHPSFKNDDDLIDKVIAQRFILRERHEAINKSMTKFWESPFGDEMKRSISDMMSSDEATIANVLSTVGGARGGTQAVERAMALQGTHDELYSLASQHAGGQISRLLAGTFSFDYTSTAAGQKRASEVRARVAELQAKRGALLNELKDSATSGVRVGSMEEALAEASRLLGRPVDATGPLSPDDPVQKLAEKLLRVGRANYGLKDGEAGPSLPVDPADEKAITEAQEEFRRRTGVGASPEDLGRRLAESYGFGDKAAGELAGAMAGSGAAMAKGRQALRTREVLNKAAARSGLTVQDLTRTVATATPQEASNFRAQWQISDAEWEEWRQSAEFQNRGTFRGAADSPAAMRAALEGTKTAGRAGPAPQHITMSGTLTINGDKPPTIAAQGTMGELGYVPQPT